MCLIIRYYGLNVPFQQGVLVFVSYSYDLWHKTVLWGTKMSYAFLLIMGLPHICPVDKIIKQEECKQQENSIMSQKRSDIAHRVTFSKLLEF